MNTPDIKSTETPALIRRLGLSRRQFMAASTGLAAASMAGPLLASPAAAAGNGVLVPEGQARHHPLHRARRDQPRPRLSTDLASGFKEVLAEAGRGSATSQIEFAGYTPERQRRRWGGLYSGAGAVLKQLGSTTTAWRPRATTAASRAPSHRLPPWRAFDAACEAGQHPRAWATSARAATRPARPTSADWQAAAERWNILGERAMNVHGLKLYTHNHFAGVQLLCWTAGRFEAQPAVRPVRSGIRRLEWFLDNTDSRYVFLEMDIYWAHVAHAQHRTYTAPDGSSVQDIFDPLATVNTYGPPCATRCSTPRTATLAGRAPPTATRSCRSAPATSTTRRSSAGWAAKGYHNPMWEQDDAGGGTANPGQSLGLRPVTATTTCPALRG